LIASHLIQPSWAAEPAFAACVSLVSVIVGQLAHGATTEDVLGDYPDLEKADVQQALEYAAWLAQEEVVTG